jgi:hypothetical protein
VGTVFQAGHAGSIPVAGTAHLCGELLIPGSAPFLSHVAVTILRIKEGFKSSTGSSTSGLAVVGCCLGTGGRRDTDMVVGEGFTPDVALYAGV